MKKLILILAILIYSISYSQCCGCKTTKKTYTKTYKKKVATYNTQTATPLNVTQIVNVYSKDTTSVISKTPVTKAPIIKDTIYVIDNRKDIKNSVAPEYELLIGIIKPKDVDMALGYSIGGNLITKIYRNPLPNTQPLFTHVLYGFEYSAYDNAPKDVLVVNQTTTVVTPTKPCDGCEAVPFDSNSNNIYVNKDIKHSVTGLTLNFGLGFYNNIFLLGGVTNYHHTFMIDGNTAAIYDKTFIDLGVKKIFKLGKYYISPTFKTNMETSTFSLGFSM